MLSLLIFGASWRTFGDAHRRRLVLTFMTPGHPRPERPLRGHLLRHLRHLGTGPRHSPEVSGEPGIPFGAGPGRAMSAGVRSLSQAVIVYGLALVLGIRTNGRPLAILGVPGSLVLAAAVFSTLSLIIACLVKTRKRFIGIGQMVTMPIFFASRHLSPESDARLAPRGVLGEPPHLRSRRPRALMPRGVFVYGLLVDRLVLAVVFAGLVGSRPVSIPGWSREGNRRTSTAPRRAAPGRGGPRAGGALPPDRSLSCSDA